MRLLGVIVICAASIGCSSASYIKTLKKCAAEDSECLISMYQGLLQGIASSGISELGVPPIDPLKLQNVVISFFGLLDITLKDGSVSGVSSCVFNDYSINFEKGTAHQKNTCNITVVGQYNVQSNGILNSLLGGKGAYGDGNAVIHLNNVLLAFDYLFYAQKRDDGEIYMKVDYDNVKHTIEFLGKIDIDFDQIYIGEEETSQTLIPFLNQNWKLINKLGPSIGDKVAEIYLGTISKIFDKVPLNQFFTDDFSSIAKP